MSIVLGTLPMVATDPTAVASMIAMIGATLTWLVIKAIDPVVRP